MSSDRTEGGEDFAALLEAFERKQGGLDRALPKVGDAVTSRVVGFGGESVFVDLGGKAEGVIPLTQVTDHEGARTVEVGDEVQGVVASVVDDVVTLRVGAGRGAAAPEELLQAHEHGLPVEGTVQAVVKGGVEVTVGGVRGFCPISQLDSRYVEDANAFVGQRLSFRIIRYEPARGRHANLVLSRRTLLEEEERARVEQARARLEVGKRVRGTVRSLVSYGAFVDLGGIEGLLHVSELGYGRVEHPNEVLEVGQEIDVEVLKIEPPDDKGRQRISLSRRALLVDPWDETAARLTPGSRHHGRVARLESFGAFVELAPGVDGLLHISELAAPGERELKHPRERLQIGESIDVRVLDLDRASRRISLALVRADAETETEQEAEATAPGRSRPAAEEGFGSLGDFFRAGREDPS